MASTETSKLSTKTDLRLLVDLCGLQPRLSSIIEEKRHSEALKALLKTFLWHPRTSDFDGLEIWKAIQHADTPEIAK